MSAPALDDSKLVREVLAVLRWEMLQYSRVVPVPELLTYLRDHLGLDEEEAAVAAHDAYQLAQAEDFAKAELLEQKVTRAEERLLAADRTCKRLAAEVEQRFGGKN
jgi:hypothetical protein